MSDVGSARSAAERKRAQRERAKLGLYILIILAGLDVVDRLIDGGYLQMHESENRERINEAFVAWIEDLVNAR